MSVFRGVLSIFCLEQQKHLTMSKNGTLNKGDLER